MIPYPTVRTLAFLPSAVHICNEKHCNPMFRRYADRAQYELFASHLLEEKPYLDPALTFRALCSRLGLPHRRLNNTLLAELGVGGQEIKEKNT